MTANSKRHSSALREDDAARLASALKDFSLDSPDSSAPDLFDPNYPIPVNQEDQRTLKVFSNLGGFYARPSCPHAIVSRKG